jgi:hypothetical protein
LLLEIIYASSSIQIINKLQKIITILPNKHHSERKRNKEKIRKKSEKKKENNFFGKNLRNKFHSIIYIF